MKFLMKGCMDVNDTVPTVRLRSPVITARNRSWGKVIFLHVSVILFTEGVSVSVPGEVSPSWEWGLHPGGLCPWGVSARGGSVMETPVQ